MTPETIVVCPKCKLEIQTGDLELNREGQTVCSRCAMEPWEHAVEAILSALLDIESDLRESAIDPATARFLHRALVTLEQRFTALTDRAAKRMEKIA